MEAKQRMKLTFPRELTFLINKAWTDCLQQSREHFVAHEKKFLELQDRHHELCSSIIWTLPRHLSKTNCNLLNVPLKIEYQLFLHLRNPSMHLCISQEEHSMLRFRVSRPYSTICNGTFPENHELKGPVCFTQASGTVLSVPFNDSLDQSGDGREKERV